MIEIVVLEKIFNTMLAGIFKKNPLHPLTRMLEFLHRSGPKNISTKFIHIPVGKNYGRVLIYVGILPISEKGINKNRRFYKTG